MCACRGEPHLLALVALDAILTAQTSPPTAKGDSSRVRLVSGAEGLCGPRWYRRAGRRAGLVVGAGQSPRRSIPGRLLRGPFRRHRLYRRLRPRLSSAGWRRCSRPSSSPPFTGPLGLGNSHSLDGITTRAAGPAHTGDQQPGGYRSGRPWDAPGRRRSTRVSPETVRPAHNLLAELWQGNPAGSERESPVGLLR